MLFVLDFGDGGNSGSQISDLGNEVCGVGQFARETVAVTAPHKGQSKMLGALQVLFPVPDDDMATGKLITDRLIDFPLGISGEILRAKKGGKVSVQLEGPAVGLHIGVEAVA